MASIAGYDYDIPLFLVSWKFAVKPSNIIVLDSSVAIKIDNVSSSSNNNVNHDNSNCRYCFDIVSTKECSDTTVNNNNSPNKKSVQENNFYNHTSSSYSSSSLTTTSTLFNGRLTKTLSTSSKTERDQWVKAINETVDYYEKTKYTMSLRGRRRLSVGRSTSSSSGNNRRSTSSQEESNKLLLLPPTSPMRRSKSGPDGEERFDLSGLSIAC